MSTNGQHVFDETRRLPDDYFDQMVVQGDEEPPVDVPPEFHRPESEAKRSTAAEGFGLLNSRDFLQADYRQSFLISRILVANQPAIVGGKSKTLKTSLMVDAALSLGSGTPFLGHFETEQRRVALLSGESGQFTIQETARRIGTSKEIDPAEADVLFGFRLPQIARLNHVAALEETISGEGVEVLIIDPAYLCLLAGDSNGSRSSDVLSMGPHLLQLTELGQRTGCTVVLCHHLRKNSAAELWSPPELEELAMAGFAEWARQWLLLGRREQYEHGSGTHRLWLNVGGSAGHSGCYAVDVDEGQLNSDFTGRGWAVDVSSAHEARQDAKRRSDSHRAERQAEEEEACKRRILDVLKRFPKGETAKQIRELTGMNGPKFGKAIQFALTEGRVKQVEVTKNNRKYEGFALTENQRPGQPGLTGTQPGLSR